MGLLRTFIGRLFTAGGTRMLKPGSIAPEFDVLDQDGVRVRLSDFKGKRVVLFFYPKADTPGCTKQVCGFRDQFSEYERKGVVVFGISFDAPAANKAFARKFNYRHRLLSDVDRKVALAYGAAEKTEDAYARRYTFVIGADGKIEKALATQDPGAQAATLLADL